MMTVAGQTRTLLGLFLRRDLESQSSRKVGGFYPDAGWIRTLVLLAGYGFCGYLFQDVFSEWSPTAGLPADLTMLYSANLMLCGGVVLGEMGTLFFNTEELQELGRHPIDARSWLAAKLLNQLVVILLLTLAFNAVPFGHGLAAGWHPRMVAANFFMVLWQNALIGPAASLLYLWLISIFNKAKLDGRLGWCQPLALGFMVGLFKYSGSSRVMGGDFFPPKRFADLAAALSRGDAGPAAVTAAIGLGSLTLLIFAAAWWRSARIWQTLGEAVPSGGDGRVRPLDGFEGVVARLAARSPEERAAYDLAVISFKRHPGLRMRIGSQLASVLCIYCLILSKVWQMKLLFWNNFFTVAGSITVLAGLYVADSLAYSENHQAAWIFDTAPIRGGLDLIFKGLQKCVFVYICLPVWIFALATQWFVLGGGGLNLVVWNTLWLGCAWVAVGLSLKISGVKPLAKEFYRGAQMLNKLAGLIVVVALGYLFIKLRGWL